MINPIGIMCPWYDTMGKTHLLVYFTVILNSGNYEQPKVLPDLMGRILAFPN